MHNAAVKCYNTGKSRCFSLSDLKEICIWPFEIAFPLAGRRGECRDTNTVDSNFRSDAGRSCQPCHQSFTAMFACKVACFPFTIPDTYLLYYRVYNDYSRKLLGIELLYEQQSFSRSQYWHSARRKIYCGVDLIEKVVQNLIWKSGGDSHTFALL